MTLSVQVLLDVANTDSVCVLHCSGYRKVIQRYISEGFVGEYVRATCVFGHLPRLLHSLFNSAVGIAEYCMYGSTSGAPIRELGIEELYRELTLVVIPIALYEVIRKLYRISLIGKVYIYSIGTLAEWQCIVGTTKCRYRTLYCRIVDRVVSCCLIEFLLLLFAIAS